MVNKYAHLLETREINEMTGNTWRLDDVPNLWKKKVLAKIEADGYIILDDGTVSKQ